MHVALRMAYDGRFPGYARQPHGGTVEDHMLDALAREGLVDGSWRAGSRTDRGVAAAGNVAKCQLDRPHLRGLIPALQAHLPEGIWITGAAPVDAEFDPRRAAWRTYEYHVQQDGEDPEAMQQACRAFVGTHDMRAFARLDGRRAQRTVLACDVELVDGWWILRVRGQSFLWNQVRRMAHAVLQVGRGRVPASSISQSLATRAPHAAFGIAPPEGLLLRGVRYEPEPAWEAGPTSKSLLRYGQRMQVQARLAGLTFTRTRGP